MIINPYSFDANTLIGPNTGLNLATHHLTTMMQEGDIPVTAVTADSDPVGTIYDQTINGLILRQPTAADRPILGSDGTRTSYLRFDGTSDRISILTSISFFNTFWQAVPKGTILIWFKMNGGDGASQQIIGCIGSATTNPGMQILRANTNKIVARGGDGTLRWTVTSTDDITTADGWVGMIVSINGVGASAGRFILMDSGGTIFNDQTFTVAAGSVVNANHDLYIGSRAANDLYFNGDLSALIVENFPVSDPLIEQFRNYNPARITTEFTPIAQWLLDMNNSAFIFSDVSLTTPVVADDIVRGMRQQIIGNFNITPAFGALRRQMTSAASGTSAQYKTNIINGKSALLFTSGDNYTVTGVPTEIFEERGGKWTFFAVVSNTDTTFGSHIFSGNNYVVLTGSGYAGETPPTTVNPYAVVHPDPVGTSVHTNTKGAGVDGFKVMAFRRDLTNLAAWNGNKTKTTSTSSSRFSVTEMGSAHPGVGNDWNMTGYIAYFKKFNGVMTDAEVEAEIDRLNAEYGL